MPSLISLFCGPGGLDQGFQEAGFITKLAYDSDPAAVATHRHNHPEADALVADLSIIDEEMIIEEWNKRSPHELPVGVIGGPPCQSFSIANAYQTDNDPRNFLTEHYARLIKNLNRVFQIDFFVFENVPGLLTLKHKDKFERFKMLFQDAGFNIFEGLLEAQYFGVPQKRKRIFIVGINKLTISKFQFCFPKGDTFRKNTVAEAIGALTEPTFFSRLQAGGEGHPNHWCMVPRSRKFTEGIMGPGRYTGRSFRVLKWDEPSYTVAYGHNEVHVHPEGRRRLSVYEAMLLQGFPRDYVLKGSFTDQIRLVSEAVPPPVARSLARSLSDQLRRAVRLVDADV
jgi:DNA (cytosine-5)-methyltransferase 1